MEVAFEADKYATPEAFAEDMRLVFKNCMSYNPPEHMYHKYAVKLLEVLKSFTPNS